VDVSLGYAKPKNRGKQLVFYQLEKSPHYVSVGSWYFHTDKPSLLEKVGYKKLFHIRVDADTFKRICKISEIVDEEEGPIFDDWFTGMAVHVVDMVCMSKRPQKKRKLKL